MKRKVVAIVDAHSSGALLPAEFKSRGIDCVHLQSAIEIAKIDREAFKREDFVDNVPFDGDLEKVVDTLSSYDLLAVIPGTDSGVPLADRLSERMNLKTNGTRLSLARRDKYLMHETIKAKGIPGADQIKSDKVGDLINWARERDKWPIVVKPLSSAGTDGLHFCYNEADVREAFGDIIGSETIFDEINKEVLAQEFFEGIEYVIDTVSCDGTHYVTIMWKYKKNKLDGKTSVYEDQMAMPYEGEIQSQLINYTFRVLDALEIKYGPAHTEIIYTKDGPRLVETQTRLDGIKEPELNHECNGRGQIQVTVDAYLNPTKFYTMAKTPYKNKKLGRILCFISRNSGRIESIVNLDKIKSLDSFFKIHLEVAPGRILKKTVDLQTCPGFVFLAHRNWDVIERDYQTIRQLEKEGIFELS